MASRTRNHILEDESRAQFRMILPSHWVVRDKPNDYGIDCEVEVFDKYGNPTGTVFWVQLKATDAVDEKKSKSFSISKTKLSQLCDYNIPVLFARYLSAKKSFYIAWARRVAFIDSNKSYKNVKVEFSELDLWDDCTSTKILSYLKKNQTIIDGNFALPVSTYLGLDGQHSCIGDLFILRSLLSKHGNLFRLEKEREEALLVLTYSRQRLLVSLMDQKGASFSLNIKEGYELELHNVKSLVLLGSLIALANLRRYNIFNEVLSEVDLAETIKLLPEVLSFLIPHLVESGSFEKYSDLIQNIIEDSQNDELNAIVAVSLLRMRNTSKEEATTTVQRFFEKQIERAKIRHDLKGYAVASYNLSNLYRQQNDLSNALKYLNDARKAYPDYLKKSYFLKELGGVLFDMERYQLSCIYYCKAMAAAPNDVLIRGLYGDALLFDGKYKLAQEQYDYYLSNAKADTHYNDIHQNEIQLKYSCLSTLLNHDEPIEQKRQVVKAIELASPDILLSDEDYDKKLHQALSLDLLCPLAWYNLGMLQLKNQDQLSGFFSFLMSSLLNRWDVISWCNTVIMCLNSQSAVQLLPYILNTANFYCGEELMIHLTKLIQEDGSTSSSKFLNAIDQIIKAPNKSPSELRIIDEGERFDAFLFDF